MNTPAHLILSAGIFARPDHHRLNAAAILGGLMPDLSLYLIGLWMLTLGGQSPETFFGVTYYTPWMQGVMAVDNSLPLWTLGLLIALALRNRIGAVFAACGIIHLVTDFLLHHEDARRQLWPISDWVFRSPVSYWDPNHYGSIASLVEVAGSAILLVVLWRRFAGIPAKAMILVAAAVQVAPGILFRLMMH